MPSLVGKAALTFLLSNTSVIIPIEPLDIHLSASMLLVKNMTLALTTQVTVEGKLVPLLNSRDDSVVSILFLFSKSLASET